VPRITYTDIVGPSGMGFTKEMFQITVDADFQAFVTAIIIEQAALLSSRVGASVYADATEPAASRVTRAEKCFTAAEVLDRRINGRLANVQAAGEEFDVTSERRQRDDYRKEAESLIALLPPAASASNFGDVAFGSVISSHFGEEAVVA
jgi:hypothetical protein